LLVCASPSPAHKIQRRTPLRPPLSRVLPWPDEHRCGRELSSTAGMQQSKGGWTEERWVQAGCPVFACACALPYNTGSGPRPRAGRLPRCTQQPVSGRCPPGRKIPSAHSHGCTSWRALPRVRDMPAATCRPPAGP